MSHAARCVIATTVRASIPILPLCFCASLSAQQIETGSGGPGEFDGSPFLQYPLFEQLDDCTMGSPSQDFTDLGAVIQLADDFVVPPGALWMIREVAGQGIYQSPDGFPVSLGETFEIYREAAGVPGELVCSAMPTNQLGNFSEDFVYFLDEGACDLPGGTYWISVYKSLPFDSGDQWFWSRNDSSNGDSYLVQDAGNLLGTGCTSWTPAGACGLSDGPDLCFGVGTVFEPGPDVVPATGAMGLVALIMMVMGTSLFLLRRRGSA